MGAMFMKPSGRSSYAGLPPLGRKKVELMIKPELEERGISQKQFATMWQREIIKEKNKKK